MKMSSLNIALCASVMLIANAVAAVSPIAIYLTNDSGQTTYTVPAGKVLIVESLRQNVGTSGITDLYLNVEQTYVNDDGPIEFSQQFRLSNTVASGRIFSLETPLRFSEGAVINKPSLNSPETSQYYVYGLLIDASDLYAANIEASIEIASLTSTSLQAEVRLATSRPAVVKVEKSTDLENWSPVSAENVTTTREGDLRSVEVDRDSSRKFLRSSAVARK